MTFYSQPLAGQHSLLKEQTEIEVCQYFHFGLLILKVVNAITLL